MAAPILSFPSRSNAFANVRSFSSRRDSLRSTGDAGGVKVIKFSLAPRPDSPRPLSIDKLAILKEALPAILGSRPLPLGQSLDSLYKICQELSTDHTSIGGQIGGSSSETIYVAAREALDHHAAQIGKAARSSLLAVGGKFDGITFLEEIIIEWKAWTAATNRLVAVLLYIERVFVPTATNAMSLSQSARKSFKESVLSEKIIEERCLQAVRTWTVDERVKADSPSSGGSSVSEVEQISRQIVHQFISLSLQLGSSPKLQEDYVESAVTYYAEIITNRLPTASSDLNGGRYSEFAAWVSDKLTQEQGRAQTLWSGETKSDGELVQGAGDAVAARMSDALKQNLVELYMVDMAKPAVDEAMARSDGAALANIYRLLVGVRKFTTFQQVFSAHVQEYSTSLISDPSKDDIMVANLLAFKSFCENSVASLFEEQAVRSAEAEQKDARRRLALETVIRSGLKEGVETRQATPAELIAKHLDQTMRRGQGTMTASEFEDLLNNIVDLVKFTKDKDVFKGFYITQLAKRLLLGKSASAEEEISMVRKLQEEYGEEFTTGDGMMKDLTQSEEMNKKYQETRMSSGRDATTLGVNVLSQGHWPPYKQLAKGWDRFALPDVMQKELDNFESWYKHTFSGRKISWRHQHASVTLTARFPSGNKEIGVSLFQALVLMLFNDADSLNFGDISDRTGIERDELIRTLQSLYAQKVTRMLIKRPAGKDVNPDDTFTWNSSFTRDRMRFKINQLQQDLSAEETKQTTDKVFEDRNLTLDAQVVRIMKSKKQLRLQDLINQVIEAVQKLFQPEVKAIKAQVESLIEREYLERDDDDRNLLRYLA